MKRWISGLLAALFVGAGTSGCSAPQEAIPKDNQESLPQAAEDKPSPPEGLSAQAVTGKTPLTLMASDTQEALQTPARWEPEKPKNITYFIVNGSQRTGKPVKDPEREIKITEVLQKIEKSPREKIDHDPVLAPFDGIGDGIYTAPSAGEEAWYLLDGSRVIKWHDETRFTIYCPEGEALGDIRNLVNESVSIGGGAPLRLCGINLQSVTKLTVKGKDGRQEIAKGKNMDLYWIPRLYQDLISLHSLGNPEAVEKPSAVKGDPVQLILNEKDGGQYQINLYWDGRLTIRSSQDEYLYLYHIIQDSNWTAFKKDVERLLEGKGVEEKEPPQSAYLHGGSTLEMPLEEDLQEVYLLTGQGASIPVRDKEKIAVVLQAAQELGSAPDAVGSPETRKQNRLLGIRLELGDHTRFTYSIQETQVILEEDVAGLGRFFARRGKIPDQTVLQDTEKLIADLSGESDGCLTAVEEISLESLVQIDIQYGDKTQEITDGTEIEGVYQNLLRIPCDFKSYGTEEVAVNHEAEKGDVTISLHQNSGVSLYVNIKPDNVANVRSSDRNVSEKIRLKESEALDWVRNYLQ